MDFRTESQRIETTIDSAVSWLYHDLSRVPCTLTWETLGLYSAALSCHRARDELSLRDIAQTGSVCGWTAHCFRDIRKLLSHGSQSLRVGHQDGDTSSYLKSRYHKCSEVSLYLGAGRTGYKPRQDGRSYQIGRHAALLVDQMEGEVE